MLHGHGNDKYKYGDKITLDFSSNTWYKPMPDEFFQHLAKSLKSCDDYPHPEAGDLKAEIAKLHQLNEEQVWVTNGSIEGIHLLAQLYKGESSSIIFPCFSEYEDACKKQGHQLSFRNNQIDFSKAIFKEKLVWIGNPNNPDGKILSLDSIKKLLYNNPQTTFIFDEAYAKLSVDFESAIPLLKQYSNLIILRSFTKCFAIPGIRLGYILASYNTIKQLSEISIPWSVNSLAIEAGKYICQHYKALLPSLKEITHLNSNLCEQIYTEQNTSIFASKTNYLLIQLRRGCASELKHFLIENYGILIRNASNFRGLDDSYIRVSLKSENDNLRLVEAISSYFYAQH